MKVYFINGFNFDLFTQELELYIIYSPLHDHINPVPPKMK